MQENQLSTNQKTLIFCILSFFLAIQSSAQETKLYPDTLNKKAVTAVAITGATIYAGGMFGLYQLWYKDYPQSHFHFINDNSEWLQMDKLGHLTTAYYTSYLSSEALKLTGLSPHKADIWGSLAGFGFMTAIEILDGYSAEWGASSGDLIANTTGASLYLGQQLLWGEQKVLLKASYHGTRWAKENPDQLGKNAVQSIIKDYNGQTIWISCNIKSLTQWERLPEWLNIAIGYGGEGMIFANESDLEHELTLSRRYRQFYLSFDIDLNRVKVRSKTLKLILKSIGFIKIPFPTLEYNDHSGLRGHLIYF